MKCPNPACKNRKARHWQVVNGWCPKCPSPVPAPPPVPPPAVIAPPRPVVLAEHARDTAFTFFDR